MSVNPAVDLKKSPPQGRANSVDSYSENYDDTSIFLSHKSQREKF